MGRPRNEALGISSPVGWRGGADPALQKGSRGWQSCTSYGITLSQKETRCETLQLETEVVSGLGSRAASQTEQWDTRFAPTAPEIGEDGEQCLPAMAGVGQDGSERSSWEESGFGGAEGNVPGTRCDS